MVTSLLILATGIFYLFSYAYPQLADAFFSPLVALFLPLTIGFIILSLFPSKIYRLWLVLSFITFMYVVYVVFSSSVDGGSCLGICYPRSLVASMASTFFFSNTAWISIVAGFIWQFISKRRSDKRE